MSYVFENKPFEWANIAGADPTAYEIALGLQGGMSLPANFLNKQWTMTYLAIKEIQEKIEDGTVGGVDADTVIENSVKVGANHTVSGTSGYALFGEGNTAKDYNFVCGKRSKAPTAADPATNTGDLFVIGCGLSGGAKSNALRVTAAGEVLGTQAYAASGADYAEMFEWLDGNEFAEDRRGLFVTLDGEKIRLATAEDDFVLGIVSAAPSVVGDACTDDWQGKYVTDVFGARVLVDGRFQLSESYDEALDESYTSRLERPEWAAIGLVGKLVVVDDGTCEPNGYCKPAANGVATAADSGYRVLARIDELHVKVLLK